MRITRHLLALLFTFILMPISAFADLTVSFKIFGHKDIRSTMAIYAHLTEERKRSSAANMVGFFDGWIGEMEPQLSQWCRNDVDGGLSTDNIRIE